MSELMDNVIEPRLARYIVTEYNLLAFCQQRYPNVNPASFEIMVSALKYALSLLMKHVWCRLEMGVGGSRRRSEFQRQ